MDKICGVDVSKLYLDAGFADASLTARFDNTADGIAKLADFCHRHRVTLVVMEATGGQQKLAFGLLWEAGVACAVCNPRNVRLYAEAMGRMEKTDTLDARVIAAFATAKALKPTPPESQKQSRLKALATALKQVTQDLIVHKQRLSQCFDAEHKTFIAEAIAFFKKQTIRLEGELASLIDDDPLWSKLDATFRSIKGVAGRTVIRILAMLPEIGLYSNKAIAKLAGTAPLANDSGHTSKDRHIRGGRHDIRSALFIVTHCVRRCNQTLHDFSDRLAKKGKPKMVIRIALARASRVQLNP